MCGIAGIFHPTGSAPVDAALLRRMTTALAHRGPDGDGFHVEPHVGLGHRRLAIIDLGGGRQPMFNEDFSVAITFNGEIYNFAELRPKLEALGHVFRSDHSDTETIIHAWESFGPDCLQHLSGQFAFALWDRNRDCLFLARDRMGKKPIYYATDPAGRFLFASELAALAQAPALPRRIDPAAVEDFFAFGYVPEPASIFAGISRLPPAHFLLLERGKPMPATDGATGTRRPRPSPRTKRPPRRGWSSCSTEATAKRLVADVPLGAFLSGGVDSSAVVATAAKLRRDPLDTFTIGFEGAEDETPYAAMVARALRHAPAQRARRRGRRDRRRAAAGPHLRRAVRRFLVGAHLQRLCAGAPARDGRDFRRRRRRGFCRVSPLPVARAGRKRAENAACGGATACHRDARKNISEAGSRAALAAGQAHADRTFARQRARLRAHGDESAARASARVVFSVAARRAGRPRRDRQNPGADGGGRHRRRAGAGAVRRPAHLVARRHPDQGRSRQHGQLAGSALAVPRRGASVLGLFAAGGAEAAGRQRKIPAEAGAGAGVAERVAVSPEAGVRDLARRDLSRRRRDGCGRGCSARRWPAACCSPPPPWRG